jgi:predicted RNA-binding Zn ribbon-like protein
VRLIQLFVNSYDDLTETETINNPNDLSRWLGRRGFPPGRRPLRPTDVTRLHAVREALRAVFTSHNGGGPPDVETIELLNAESARATLAAAFSPAGQPNVEGPAPGVPGLLAALFAAGIAGAQQGMWERLKACPGCGWVFYDHSRNGRGIWCTMAICGSRAKMRAYRRRRSRGLTP